MVALHLLDKNEIDLPYDKQVTMLDLESGAKLQIDPRELRDTYQQQVNQYLGALRRSCSDCGVEYQVMYVDEP